MGVSPDIVVGASAGAVVGGCFAAGHLSQLEAFARSLTKRRVFGLMDVSFSGGGLIAGNRLRARLEQSLGSINIEDLPIRFASVATEVGAGHEIWLKQGPLVTAIPAIAGSWWSRPASSRARRTTGPMVATCARPASSGTTPPNARCCSMEDSTTEERTCEASSTTAAAVSSQLVSIPSTNLMGPA